MLIDSAPPATIVVAPPLITRSAAYAMAWSPDAQKRFTVTADAVTGTPARRLAIRATLSPCSASGIAQPRITSSTSAGSSPGTRAIASLMTTAAISSGRVYRSAPFGALPTGVRTAETMNASTMKAPEQIFERFADFRCVAAEKVVRHVDDDELFWFRECAVELPHVLQRADVVRLPLHEELGLRADPRVREVVTHSRDRRSNPDERGDASVGRSGLEGD